MSLLAPQFLASCPARQCRSARPACSSSVIIMSRYLEERGEAESAFRKYRNMMINVTCIKRSTLAVAKCAACKPQFSRIPPCRVCFRLQNGSGGTTVKRLEGSVFTTNVRSLKFKSVLTLGVFVHFEACTQK